MKQYFDSPFFIRELRTFMRNKKVYIMMMIYVLGLLISGLSISFTFLPKFDNDYSFQTWKVGKTTFQVIFGIHAMLMFFLGSFISGPVITSEKEGKTYDLLITTPLESSSLVLGKLAGIACFLSLMLGASLPVFYIVLSNLGGVTITDIIIFYFCVIGIGILSASIGIFASAISKKTSAAIGLSLRLEFLIVTCISFGIGFALSGGSGNYSFGYGYSPFSSMLFAPITMLFAPPGSVQMPVISIFGISIPALLVSPLVFIFIITLILTAAIDLVKLPHHQKPQLFNFELMCFAFLMFVIYFGVQNIQNIRKAPTGITYFFIEYNYLVFIILFILSFIITTRDEKEGRTGIIRFKELSFNNLFSGRLSSWFYNATIILAGSFLVLFVFGTVKGIKFSELWANRYMFSGSYIVLMSFACLCWMLSYVVQMLVEKEITRKGIVFGGVILLTFLSLTAFLTEDGFKRVILFALSPAFSLISFQSKDFIYTLGIKGQAATLVSVLWIINTAVMLWLSVVLFLAGKLILRYKEKNNAVK